MNHIPLDGGGQLQKTQGVGDRRAAATDALGHSLLGEAKLVDEELIGVGFFDWAELIALDIFD
jgi:hypothetical protein